MHPIETRRLKALLIGVYVLLSLLVGGIFAALWSWPLWTGFVAMVLVSFAIWWLFIADEASGLCKVCLCTTGALH